VIFGDLNTRGNKGTAEDCRTVGEDRDDKYQTFPPGCRGAPSPWVGGRGSLEKGRMGGHDLFHRGPLSGRTDCPIENTAQISSGNETQLLL